MPQVLSRRRLNRALLARQHLLERVRTDVPTEIEHLVGLQAQEPLDPYTALWSRIAGFAPGHLGDLVESRAAVRICTLRGTVHLHTADDALLVRALAQPSIDRRIAPGNMHGRAVAGLDLPALQAETLAWFAEEPRNGTQLKARLAERFPDRDADRLVDVLKYSLPLAQIAPRGVWGRSKRATWSPLDGYVGRPLRTVGPADEDALILRYLTAFGPASVADIATWSGWTAVAEKVDRIRDRLVVFEHEDTGRELLDVPDGLLPAADAPAPVRFLSEFDNVVLSHADRSRIVPPGLNSETLIAADPRPKTLLVDGFVAGLWSMTKERGLVVRPMSRWTKAQQRAVEREGAALTAFWNQNVR